MDIVLRVTLKDGRIGATTSTTAHDLDAVCEFVNSIAHKVPEAEWTISAGTGPEYTSHYADIESVELTVYPGR